MHCPKCRKESLREIQVGEVKTRVDHCRTCGGIWFDQRELETIMTVAVKDLVVPSGAVETDRMCPRDFEAMYAFKYPQTEVTVDLCRKCSGLWLDGGELTEIKKVRAQLAGCGELDRRAPETGLVGGLGRLFEWVVDEVSDLELDSLR